MKLLIGELIRRIEELKARVKWTDELENTLVELKKELGS